VTIDERTGFEPHATLHPGCEPSGVLLHETEDGLRVQVEIDRYGMPRRDRRPPAVRLMTGNWIRWQINYRFPPPCACGDEWRYRLDTLNLAYGPVEIDTFAGTPTYFVDERRWLR
jgi:hypothetical protein